MNLHKIHSIFMQILRMKISLKQANEIALLKHTIFGQILHYFMQFSYNYHVKLILRDFRA